MDLYPKVTVLTYGLTNNFRHALLVEKGFLIYHKPNIFWIALGHSKLSDLWSSLIFRWKTIFVVWCIHKSLKIGLEAGLNLENYISWTADFCSLVILEFIFKGWP